MKFRKLVSLLLFVAVSPALGFSQAAKNKTVSQGGISAIKESEIKADLYSLADDHFRGREAGTLDELRASMWLADRARAAGLKPAGDDGTYFQFFSMWRNRISPTSSIKIGDSAFHLWRDTYSAQIAPAHVAAPVIFINSISKDELDKADIKGKAVALLVSPEGINLDVSLADRRYPGYVQRKYSTELLSRGAAAIIFIADALGEQSWKAVEPAMTRGLYDVEGGANERVTEKVPVIWVHADAVDYLKRRGLTLSADINSERFEYPSVNIIGKIEGTDAFLSKEYVLFSGHQDHDGVRQPDGSDSIYNGADDNATVAVALLAIARAFKQKPGKRSALFVWHGAEERGLLGSKWYSAHPTVPKESIVAVLNGDMIGRNNPDSAALLGVQSPHRNSAELVSMALAANNEGAKFRLDTMWDKPTHVEGWYFRSDHLPYARAGIPALFFTTLLHPDYHTPRDEASRIDIKKLTRMTEWMYRTGWKVANIDKRPALEANFKLER